MLRRPLHYYLSLLLLAGMLLEGAHVLSEHNQGLPAPPMNIIVIGGSSGMGKAAAIACVKRGGKVLLVSRSNDKLAKAAEEVRSYAPSEDLLVETAVLDATDEDAVKKFVAETMARSEEYAPDLDTYSDWDALVVSAAGKAPHGPLATLPTDSTRELFESKFWSAYHCAKHIGPVLRAGGAVVFVAGVLNRRPGMNCSPLASTNGALEGLTRALALEWGPQIRVNCLRYVCECVYF